MSLSRRWLLAGLLGALLLFLLGWVLLINPARNTAADLRVETEYTNQENARLAARIEQLKQQSAEVPKKLQEIESVKQKMPAEVKQSELVRTIEREAQSAGVDLIGIAPAAPVQLEATTTKIVALPFTLTANGRYANIKTFVDNLERIDRAFLIKTVQVTTEDSTVGEFAMSLSGDFFSLPDAQLDAPTPSAVPDPAAAPSQPAAAAAATVP